MNASGAACAQQWARPLQTDAGVDHDRNNTRLEQAQTPARRSRGPGRTISTARSSALDPRGIRPSAIAIAVAVELSVSQMRVTRAAGAVSSRRRDDRPLVRLARRHRDQVPGDVRRLAENKVLAQPTGSSDRRLGREKLLHEPADRIGFILEQIMARRAESDAPVPRETGAPIPPENGDRTQNPSCPKG